MKCKILHESKGRLRIHAVQGRMTLAQADILEAYLLQLPCVTDAKVYDRTCDAVIFYHGQRNAVLTALAAFRYENAQALAPEHSGRALNREYQDKLFFTLCRRVINRTIIPLPIRTALTLFRSVRYLWAGLSCLRKGHIQVPVLDATAITVSLLRRDFKTAGSIMFLLSIGETLDEWTHKKSVADLARTMSLNVDQVWLETEGGSVQVSLSEVEAGDRIIVRTGSMIPLDGKVVAGEAMVNQASITGEPLAVRKTIGGYVYAGTVVEEGDCTICVEKTAGSGRYDRIVHMIEESEKLKSTTESKAHPPGRQPGALQPGGDRPDLAADPECEQGAGGADGRLLLCAEAVHAHRGAFCYEGGQHPPAAGEGRTVHGGGLRGGYHSVRQDRHSDLRRSQSGQDCHLRWAG